MVKALYLSIQERLTELRLFYATQVFLGSLYIAFLAQLEIPLRPIPVTLHTFAIFTLALYLGKNKASLSAILYLAEATMGLPVFPSLWSDPLWILHPSAGFCLSFPFAAYIIGYIAESKPNNFFQILLSICTGKAVIYLFGVAWLSYFIGVSQALTVGFYPFLFVAVLKISAAVSLKMGSNKLHSFLSA
jgi:biotin transport system substrate-specific component